MKETTKPKNTKQSHLLKRDLAENIAVLPQYQGQGLGRHLLSHAEEKVRKATLRELRLLTNQAFAANIRLYESVGFRIDRTEPFAGGGTTVYMSKTIEPM